MQSQLLSKISDKPGVRFANRQRLRTRLLLLLLFMLVPIYSSFDDGIASDPPENPSTASNPPYPTTESYVDPSSVLLGRRLDHPEPPQWSKPAQTSSNSLETPSPEARRSDPFVNGVELGLTTLLRVRSISSNDDLLPVELFYRRNSPERQDPRSKLVDPAHRNPCS